MQGADVSVRHPSFAAAISFGALQRSFVPTAGVSGAMSRRRGSKFPGRNTVGEEESSPSAVWARQHELQAHTVS